MFAAILARGCSGLPRSAALLGAVLGVLTLGWLGLAAPATADPNPILNGTSCADIKANAQSDRSDPDGPSGIDNWGATGACAASVTQEGWGYDYKHAYFWVKDMGGGRLDLFICAELFGHPGDSDADGGYLSNNAPSCGAYPPSCSGFEGTSGIIGPSEEITIELFPDCTPGALMSFTLTNDLLIVTQNAMGSGPGFLTVLGNRTNAWDALPLVQNGADSLGTAACTDPTTRRGAVVFQIANFQDFFAARKDLTPYVFNWKVLGGHSADQMSEDSVEGQMRQLPAIDIEKTANPLNICTLEDATTFTLTVTNTGFVPLFNVTVRDTLPPGLSFSSFGGVCQFDDKSVLGNEITFVADTLLLGQSKTCSFEVATVECDGQACNRATVVGDVLHPCFEAGIQASDSDTTCVTCYAPDVSIAARDTASCVGQTVQVPVTVVNESTVAEDLVLSCYVDGVAQAPVVFAGVPAGGVRSSNVSVTCANPDTVDVFCRVVGTAVGVAECTARDSVAVQVVCGQAVVDVALTNASACVGDTVHVPALVTNSSSGPADVTVNCTVNGAPRAPVVFTSVEAGGQRSFTVDVVCEEPGVSNVSCTAVASLGSNPSCTDDDTAAATATCRLAAVSIDVQAAATCVGQTVQVPVIVTNHSSEAANLAVTCTVNGGAPQSVPGLVNPYAPEGADTVYVPVLCETEGVVPVSCTVSAVLVADAACTDQSTDQDTVTCSQATVEVEVDDAEACVNTTTNVPVRVINTSSGAENVTLNCSINGVAQPPVVINNLAAGDTSFTTLPVTCTTPGTVPLSCTVSASLVSNPACTDDDSDTGTVTCRQALVDLTLTSAAECAGDTVHVAGLVTNSSSEPADLTVACSVNGVPRAPLVFNGVAAGGQQAFTVDVPCTGASVSNVSCTATAALVSLPTCTDSETKTATATCRLAQVAIDVQAAATCVGQTVQVPVIVTNQSSENANLSVTCTVNGGPPQSVAGLVNPYAPGAKDTVYVAVLCEVEGVVPVSCTVTATLVADETCTDDATDQADVTCSEAKVAVVVGAEAACVSQTPGSVDVLVINTATGTEDITLFCKVNGVDRSPVPLSNVAAGDTATVALSYTCTGTGSIQLICEARAQLDNNPLCTAVARDTAEVTCTQTCVDIAVGSGKGCVGDTVHVPVTVTNCADEPSDLFLVCTYDGAVVRDTLYAVRSDSVTTMTIPIVCEEPGVMAVQCTVTGRLVSNPSCTDDASAQGSVRCVEACVAINVGNGGQIPAGPPVNIPVTVSNCGPDTADITVVCVVDGDSTTTSYPAVPGLGNRTFQIPVACTAPDDTTYIFCYATAVVRGLPGCDDQAMDSTFVYCTPCTPCVSVLFTPGQACANSYVCCAPICFLNCEATEPINMLVTVYVDDEIQLSHLYTNVQPGQSGKVCDAFHFTCGDSVSNIVVVVDSWLVRDPSCRGIITETYEWSCHQPCVEVEVADAAACTGTSGPCCDGPNNGQAQVKITVTNCADEAENISVVPRVGIGAPRPPVKFNNVPSGESRSFFTPALCRPTGPERVTATATAKLVALPFCDVVVVDTGYVVCIEPSCELSVDNLQVPVSQEALLPVTVSNTSTGPQDFTLAYTVGGVAKPPVVITGLPGGTSQVVNLPILLTQTGPVTVEVNGSGHPTGADPLSCEALCEATATVTAVEFDVEVVESDLTICAHEAMQLPLSVLNSGTGATEIALGYTLDGVAHDPVVFEVLPGKTCTLIVDMPARDAGVEPLVRTMTARLCGPPNGHTLAQQDQLLVVREGCATTGVGEARVIEKVALSAFPNPIAQGTTTILYAVPVEHAGRNVALTIYDVSGRVVRHLVEGTRDTGEYTATWDLRADDGTVVSAGVYFSHLLVGPEKKTQRLLVIR